MIHSSLASLNIHPGRGKGGVHRPGGLESPVVPGRTKPPKNTTPSPSRQARREGAGDGFLFPFTPSLSWTKSHLHYLPRPCILC